VSITERDKKVLLVFIPLVLLLGYWFLLLSPQRQKASTAGDELAKQEQRRDAARQQVDRLRTARSGFASDYTELVRLGKAAPSAVDMPSLIVQLDAAAHGTGIRFSRIATGDDQGSGSSSGSAPQPPASPGGGAGSQPAAAGGASAQSGPGQAAEHAGNAVNGANDASSAAGRSGVNPGDAQTSTSSRQGGLPVGGGKGATTGSGGAGAAPSTPGLETVPLELEFKGDFFHMADFFHRLKRFVRVAGERVLVRGRLLTIDSLKFSSDPQLFPKVKAQFTATVYLAPRAQGTTAGATPQGPAQRVPASTGSTGSAGGNPPPTATATR
jgi:hypothetical protein